MEKFSIQLLYSLPNTEFTLPPSEILFPKHAYDEDRLSQSFRVQQFSFPVLHHEAFLPQFLRPVVHHIPEQHDSNEQNM